MAESAAPHDALQRYSAIEQAYCDERWSEVIRSGQDLLNDLMGSSEAVMPGLVERLELLMAHAHLYGLGDRDNAEGLYAKVLRSGAEPSLRQIAEQGLQQCNRPAASPRGAAASDPGDGAASALQAAATGSRAQTDGTAQTGSTAPTDSTAQSSGTAHNGGTEANRAQQQGEAAAGARAASGASRSSSGPSGESDDAAGLSSLSDAAAAAILGSGGSHGLSVSGGGGPATTLSPAAAAGAGGLNPAERSFWQGEAEGTAVVQPSSAMDAAGSGAAAPPQALDWLQAGAAPQSSVRSAAAGPSSPVMPWLPTSEPSAAASDAAASNPTASGSTASGATAPSPAAQPWPDGTSEASAAAATPGHSPQAEAEPMPQPAEPAATPGGSTPGGITAAATLASAAAVVAAGAAATFPAQQASAAAQASPDAPLAGAATGPAPVSAGEGPSARADQNGLAALGADPGSRPAAGSPEAPLIPEVVEEPELIELHQADPLRAEELELSIRESLPGAGFTAAAASQGLKAAAAELRPDAPAAMPAQPQAAVRIDLNKREPDIAAPELQQTEAGVASDAGPEPLPEPGFAETSMAAESVLPVRSSRRRRQPGPFASPPQPVAEEDPEMLLGLLRLEMG